MSLKREMERQLNVPVQVRMGAPGALNVLVDGQQIYSKKQSGRLPTADELISLIRPKLPSSLS